MIRFSLALSAATLVVGMLAAEAASAQVYGTGPSDPDDKTVLITSSLVVGTAGILANLHRDSSPNGRTARALLGGVAGGLAIAGGITVVSDDQVSDATKAWGASCVAVGGVAVVMAILQARHDPSPQPSSHVGAGLWQSRDGAPGLAVRVHY